MVGNRWLSAHDRAVAIARPCSASEAGMFWQRVGIVQHATSAAVAPPMHMQ
jgi:hypothetical protein